MSFKNRHFNFLRAGIIAGMIALPGLLAAQDGNPPKLVPVLGWDLAVQGGFVTSVTVDAQNNIWAGTEGKGVWRYDAREKKWTQFTAKDGLGDDNIYALAVDKLGRVWAGHLNHGVSVWNGEKWKNYGLLDGPLGDRVFSIATCPTDGDVWIATDCGVARYSIANDDWDYFTRASGLPSNQIQTIAFDALGNIFLGTQCDGITMALADEKYQKWTTTPGMKQIPDASTGPGLATALINCIALVVPPANVMVPAETERVIAATVTGISASTDKGGQFNFVRGEDWQENVNGLFNVPSADDTPPSGQPLFIRGGGVIIMNGGRINMVQRNMLMEDWVTCVFQEKETGHLWAGYRTKGLELRNFGVTESVRIDTEGSEAFLVRSIWVGKKVPPLVAVYDEEKGGLKTLSGPEVALEPGDEAPKQAPPFPASAQAPAADSLSALTKRLDVFKNKFVPGTGAFLGDDWRTQGDWIGRYGSSYAMLCGRGKTGVFEGEPGYEVSVGVGPHRQKETKAVSFINPATSENPGTLYDPVLGRPDASEINDGSVSRETYPYSWEGPDLWVDIKVPEGIHSVTLYFQNNDAHTGSRNKLRDYDLQLLPWAENPAEVQVTEPVTRARVTDFYGGVYKQFVVAGPFRYVLRVGRNHSFLTKLQGVFIDRLTGTTVGKRKPLPGFENVTYAAPVPPAPSSDETIRAAVALWTKLDASFDKNAIAGLQAPLRIWSYRAAADKGAPPELLTNWRWQTGIWMSEDREAFQKATAEAFKAYSEKHPLEKPEKKLSN